MKDSFIGKDEINDFLNTIDNNRDNSLFRISDTENKNSSNKNSQVGINCYSDKKCEETPFRFVILILYSFLSFSNGMQWVTFAAISDKFQKVYDMSHFLVDMFSMSYMIIYPFINFPCSYIIDKKSMRAGILISAILTVLGASTKYFINKSMFFAFLGQSLAAVAQPFILNSPGKVASTWFREDRRALVTSICCVSNTLGIIFGYLCPTFFLEDSFTDDTYKKQIEKYLMAETIISICLCVPVILFMKSKPHVPPSNSQINYESPPLLECIKIMWRNKSFLKFLVSFTFVLGYFNAYGTIVNSYFSKYNLSLDETSYVAACANIFAIVNCFVSSLIVDKFKNYKKIFIILNTIGLLSHICMTVFLEIFPDSGFIIFIIFWTICSMTILPIYTLSMDFVCELTYPVGESISGGFIMTFNQISGIILIVLSDYLMESFVEYKFLPNVLNFMCLVISFFAIISIEEKLLRHEKDIEN